VPLLWVCQLDDLTCHTSGGREGIETPDALLSPTDLGNGAANETDQAMTDKQAIAKIVARMKSKRVLSELAEDCLINAPPINMILNPDGVWRNFLTVQVDWGQGPSYVTFVEYGHDPKKV
jgi:hypothetical protein